MLIGMDLCVAYGGEEGRPIGTILTNKVGLTATEEPNRTANMEKDWFELGRPRLGLAALDKDYVAVPWQPVVYSLADKKATVWNRTYSFADQSLLSAVNCDGVEILVSPISLNVQINGQSGNLQFAEPEIVKEMTGKGRVVLRRTGGFSTLHAELTYTIEYDGLIWCELKLTMPDGRPTFEQLQLAVKLKREAAELTHYVGAHRYLHFPEPAGKFLFKGAA